MKKLNTSIAFVIAILSFTYAIENKLQAAEIASVWVRKDLYGNSNQRKWVPESRGHEHQLDEILIIGWKRIEFRDDGPVVLHGRPTDIDFELTLIDRTTNKSIYEYRSWNGRPAFLFWHPIKGHVYEFRSNGSQGLTLDVRAVKLD